MSYLILNDSYQSFSGRHFDVLSAFRPCGRARRHGASGLSISIGPPCSAIDAKTCRPLKR